MTAEIVFTPDNTNNSEPTTSRNLRLVESNESLDRTDDEYQNEKRELETELESIEHGFWLAVYAEKFTAHDTVDSFAVPRSSTDVYQAPFRRKREILLRLEIIDSETNESTLSRPIGSTALRPTAILAAPLEE
jgi:hypothetical protein